MKKQKSQINDVVAYLRTNKTITSMEAFNKFHATRLASIIYTLRKRGYRIETEDCQGKNEYGVYNYAKYILMEEPNNADTGN